MKSAFEVANALAAVGMGLFITYEHRPSLVKGPSGAAWTLAPDRAEFPTFGWEVIALSNDQLDETLKSLHQELTPNPDLSAESRALLEEIARDIEALRQPASDKSGAQNFADRVREAAALFEEEHPALVGVLTRLSDTLSAMGI